MLKKVSISDRDLYSWTIAVLHTVTSERPDGILPNIVPVSSGESEMMYWLTHPRVPSAGQTVSATVTEMELKLIALQKTAV